MPLPTPALTPPPAVGWPDFIAATDAPPVGFRDMFLAGCEALARQRDLATAPVVTLFRPGNDRPRDPSPAAPAKRAA